MMRGPWRERVLVIAAAAVLVVFVLVFAVALPMVDRAGRLAADTKELTDRIAEASRMYEGLPAMREESVSLAAEVGDLTKSRADVARELDGLTSDLGIRLVSVRPEDPEPVAGCLKHVTTFNVETDYAHMVRLLYELEQPEHRLWVEEVRISPPRRGADELQVLITVAAYVVGVTEESDAEA
jgi:hypothetical protein